MSVYARPVVFTADPHTLRKQKGALDNLLRKGHDTSSALMERYDIEFWTAELVGAAGFLEMVAFTLAQGMAVEIRPPVPGRGDDSDTDADGGDEP